MGIRTVTQEVGATFFKDSATESNVKTTVGEESTYWPGVRPIDNFPTSEEANAGGSSPSESHENATRVREVTPLIRIRRPKAEPRQFQVLQQFEGVVTRVTSDCFEADLRDLTAPKNPLEVAELPLAEVSPADIALIKPGCVFYWIIGYETRRGGQITNSSEIRVRRAPAWTTQKLAVFKSQGRELFTLEEKCGEAGNPDRSA